MILPDNFLRRMAPEDRPKGPAGWTASETLEKNSLRLERDEQRLFANWCLLHALPYCWHATHKRSSGTTGIFDFWVGKGGQSAWIEFKISPRAKLRAEQQAFCDKLLAQGLRCHVVTSAEAAIRIVSAWK